MNFLVVGLGVIGTTYAYALQKAGHTVEHFVRESKRETIGAALKVNLLDGRENPKGVEKKDAYPIKLARPGGSYDFIMVSLSMGKVEAAIQDLSENNIKGTVVLLCGTWESKESIHTIMGAYPYILGYPIAGGKIDEKTLHCVLFDSIMLESKENASIPNYSALIQAFHDAKIKVECPYDMLEWIWIHMAINAAVISTGATYAADFRDMEQGAEALMNSAKALSEAVLVIRETIKIVEARGVDLKKYKKELMPYKIPSKIAGVVMKRMFANNVLTRKIMTLHGNGYDLIYICKTFYDAGHQLNVKAPRYYKNYPICLANLKRGL
ncbi:MAG: NAD(P)-binding domain-containing protein [Firmicutes bacterium]|nr:NAD(P)-binding domain-containing protein [Bacillota bacterium]